MATFSWHQKLQQCTVTPIHLFRGLPWGKSLVNICGMSSGDEMTPGLGAMNSWLSPMEKALNRINPD